MACSKLRKSECEKSDTCSWIVGKGCRSIRKRSPKKSPKRNSQSPKKPHRRARKTSTRKVSSGPRVTFDTKVREYCGHCGSRGSDCECLRCDDCENITTECVCPGHRQKSPSKSPVKVKPWHLKKNDRPCDQCGEPYKDCDCLRCLDCDEVLAGCICRKSPSPRPRSPDKNLKKIPLAHFKKYPKEVLKQATFKKTVKDALHYISKLDAENRLRMDKKCRLRAAKWVKAVISA